MKRMMQGHAWKQGMIGDRCQLPRTLFLGDLPLLCTEHSLYELFSPYGRIESIQLKKEEPRCRQSWKKAFQLQYDQRHHLSYGFVKFETHNSAAVALQNLNNVFILGRRIRVCWARDNPGLEYLPSEALASTMQPGGGDKKTAQIHVLYMTPIMHKTISELDLYEVFRAFGKVVDVTIKKSVMNEVRLIQSGYGFVHFELSDEGIRSALQAIEVMNHRVINHVTYEVTITYGLKRHLYFLSLVKEGQNSFPPYHKADCALSPVNHHISPSSCMNQAWGEISTLAAPLERFPGSPKVEQVHPSSSWDGNLLEVFRPSNIPDQRKSSISLD